MRTSKENCLLLGFGDLAQRLASRLGRDYVITGVRRSACRHDVAETVQANILDRQAVSKLLTVPRDIIVLTLTPSELSDEGYRQAYVETMQTLLSCLQLQIYKKPRLIVFASSTSVYDQSDAQWVNESSVTKPKTYNGQRVLEAEQLLGASGLPHCIVRFSGIYGPGRNRLIEQVVNGESTEKKPVLYSNRIHADDCAAILMHIIERQKNAIMASLYLASDCLPAPLYEVKEWLAQELGLPVNHLQAKPSGRSLRSSKRCCNQRLLDSGYEFIYPDYRIGYRALLQSYNSNSSSNNNNNNNNNDKWKKLP
jgi:nucleoside-diphosphate-sugar epimerase